MSLLYPDLENNFPDSIDNFDKFLDPTLSTLTAINQYYTLFDSGDIAGATAILDANPTLKQMIVNAENLNKLRDGIIALQRYYMDDIQQYLIELVEYKGVYNSSATYTKYDVVNYTVGTTTESYMGIVATIPIGTLPTNTNYFIKITLKGEQGVSGTGLSYRGAWSNATQYYADDCVAYDSSLWSANVDSLNSEPTEINTNWLKIIDFSQQTILSATQPTGQVTGDFWLEDLTNGNFQQKVLNSSGTYDNIYPKTNASNVTLSDNTTVEAKVFEHLATSSSETVKGHVELATSAETTTGTSTSLAVHPAGLKTELNKKISHSLATAVNDFLVASGAGTFAKKTLAEVKTTLGLGTAAYTNSTAYATAAQGVLATNAIPISQKNALNGIPSLDASGHVPSTQLALNAMSAISTEGLVWELLAVQTFTVDTASFTFSSIPTDYTAFRIVGDLDGFDSTKRNILMTFNNISTDTEYSSSNLVNGVYTTASNTANGIQINVNSDIGSRRLLDIMISNTGNWHQVYATHGGVGHLGMTSGEYEDSGSITSIKLTMSSFDSTSRFKLFGSKTAL